MRIAVIGKGNVGQALAPNLQAAGHEVCYGVRDPADPKYAGGEIKLKRVADAAASAEIVILAIMWEALDDVLAECGDLAGKILVDCINPYDFQRGLAPLVPAETSAAQLIAARTKASVVKSFNQVGAPVMADAPRRKLRPLQFVAGDDEASRTKIIALAREIGFDARDAGTLDFARDLEGMARIWIAQAFAKGMDVGTSWALVAD